MPVVPKDKPPTTPDPLAVLAKVIADLRDEVARLKERIEVLEQLGS